jgi:pyridoxamine 5'-phosphate oxidase
MPSDPQRPDVWTGEQGHRARSNPSATSTTLTRVNDTPPIKTRDEILDSIWSTLSLAVTDRRHPMHTPVVANVAADGRAVARVVVFRKVVPEERSLFFHTDVRCLKVADLRRDPRIAWTFYEPTSRVQIRAEGLASIHDTDTLADDRWSNSADYSRICYTQGTAPSTPLSAQNAIEKQIADGRPNFSAVRTVVTQFEWLLLHHAGHQRMLLNFRDGRWSHQWLAP